MNKFKMWHLAVICIAVFLIFGAISTVAILRYNFNNPSSWDWSSFNIALGSAQEYTIDKSESQKITSQSEIEINTVSSAINVSQSEGDILEVHLYGDYTSSNGEIELEVKEVGSTIKINVKYPNFGIRKSEFTLDVKIPESYSGSLNIDSVSSRTDFDCADISFETLSVDTVSGRISLGNINADEVKINTTSGDVSGNFVSGGSVDIDGVSAGVKISGITGYVDIDTVSGTTELGIAEFDGIKVDTTSGDVTINFDNEEDFYVSFDTVSGDLDCDIPLMIEKKSGSSVNAYSGNESAKKIEVDTVSGDLEITQ